MPNETNRSETGRQPFRFKIGYDGKPDKPIDATLYAFDTSGTFLTSGQLLQGEAALDLKPEQLKRARLFVAPTVHEKRKGRPTLKTMAHLNAYEPTWRFEERRQAYELLAIPSVLWPQWCWCSCRVRGQVIKVETLGGVTYEKPVCHARVHICEVDRIWWIIERLPDPVIWRLRDELIQAVERPIPIRIPDPNPPDPLHIDPGTIDPVPVYARAANVFGNLGGSKLMFNPQPEPPGSPERFMLMTARNVEALINDPSRQAARIQSARLSTEILSSLQSKSIRVVRDALIKNIDLVRYYWCEWDWLVDYLRYLWFYDCEELGVIETDENGRFDTTVWYPCGDQPDLYFWVEYSIGGAWTTVYNPPIRCNTYWDYQCGSDVTIRITDPRVSGCGDRPELQGMKVVVKTIAREVSMGEIYRDSAVPSEKAKEGQVKEGWINTTKPSPFGAVLEPRVDFGNGLKAANITHYRWSHRPLGSTNDADWQVIDAPVSRHYREATAPGDPVVYKSVQIGPDTTVPGYYTIIDPVLPANGEDWEVLDEGYDLASAYYDTTVLAPGKYELKLELFRSSGGVMTRIDLTAEGVDLYEITDPAPLVSGSYTTTPAQNDRVLTELSGHVVAYRLVLHSDNRLCFGTINDVTVNGTPAGHCGFLEYNNPIDSARIAFRASHPDNFASFEFRVVRVSTQVNEATTSGLVDDASDNGFTRTGDTFVKDVTIVTLMASGLALGETPCTRAAFAEALHVYALATNGYGRLSGLDGPRLEDPNQVNLKAFAITHA